MGFFETVPQITANSSAFTLSNEIVSADSLNIFIWAIISGIFCGFIFATLKKITFWVWR